MNLQLATDPVLEILEADYDRLRFELSPRGYLELPESDRRSDQILNLAAEIERLKPCSPGTELVRARAVTPITASRRNVPRTLRLLFASTEVSAERGI